MLSGSCVLTSKYHGGSDIIDHGVDGFVVPDNPLSYANAIHELMNGNYRNAVAIGQRGKAKAQKLFGIERYLDDLEHIIYTVANGDKPVWNGDKLW